MQQPPETGRVRQQQATTWTTLALALELINKPQSAIDHTKTAFDAS